jgi:excisionase family DNA binding protein
VGEDRDTAQDRVTIQEAARRLGVKEDAIRKRIQRGTLRHEKTEEGRVFVWVDTTQDTAQATTEDAYQDTYRTLSATEFIQEMRGRIEDLREQLASERRANEENRRIIAALTQRIPEIEAPPSQEPSDSPTEATEQPGRVGPQTEVGGPQEGTERISWWRKWFGFE